MELPFKEALDRSSVTAGACPKITFSIVDSSWDYIGMLDTYSGNSGR